MLAQDLAGLQPIRTALASSATKAGKVNIRGQLAAQWLPEWKRHFFLLISCWQQKALKRVWLETCVA